MGRSAVKQALVLSSHSNMKADDMSVSGVRLPSQLEPRKLDNCDKLGIRTKEMRVHSETAPTKNVQRLRAATRILSRILSK